jgi:O-antigen/teichoic acid export membrane protein
MRLPVRFFLIRSLRELPKPMAPKHSRTSSSTFPEPAGQTGVIEKSSSQETGRRSAPIINSGNLGRAAARNSAGQAVGRLLIAGARLAIAASIARIYGKIVFAEYSLLIGILTMAEWLLDFGTLDIFVREACREPARLRYLLSVAAASKSIQFPVAFLSLILFLAAMRYPGGILVAAIPAGLSLLFYAGVLTYRIHFRATLTMERDALAELASVVLMIPLIWFPITRTAGLTGLGFSYLISRGAFFILAARLSGSSIRWSPRSAGWRDLKDSFSVSFPIGVAGFIVVVYEALDIILISLLSGVGQVAYYSGAQRFVWPVLTAQAAISATLYPIAASSWTHARHNFNRACQRGLDLILAVGGLAVSTLIAGSAFLLHLLGRDLAAAAPALRILALICLAKAISSTLGPLLYIAGHQTNVLQVVGVAVVAKAVIIASVASRWGYLGVAGGVVACDFVFATLPLVFLVRKFCGYRVQWSVPCKIVASTLASAGIALLLPGSAVVAAIAAPMIYTPLALLTGAAKRSDLEILLRKGE